MKVLILEDDSTAADFVERLILDFFPEEKIEIVGKAKTVKEASKIFNSKSPDLLIMDINLGDHTSFDLFEYIDPSQLNLIFTSSYDEYALKALKVNAVDYLMKPINIEEFGEALKKAKERIKLNYIRDLNKLHKDGNPEDLVDKMLIFENKSLIPISISEVVKIKSSGSYSQIYLKDGKYIASSKSLGTYENLLGDKNFIRIHDNCLINMAYVVNYKSGIKSVVVLADQSIESISKRKKKEFLEHYGY